jgi:hypothetical protein
MKAFQNRGVRSCFASTIPAEDANPSQQRCDKAGESTTILAGDVPGRATFGFRGPTRGVRPIVPAHDQRGGERASTSWRILAYRYPSASPEPRGSGDERGPHLNYAPRSHKGASVKLWRRISRPREARSSGDRLVGVQRSTGTVFQRARAGQLISEMEQFQHMDSTGRARG